MSKDMTGRLVIAAALAILMLAPAVVFAHEVYVLTPAEIQSAVSMPSPNPFSVIPSQELLFLGWGLLILLLVVVVLRFSVIRPLERLLDPWLARLKRYAPLLGRLTIGFSFIASAWFGALFGPELPLTTLSATYAVALRVVLFALGALLILGFRCRIVAAAGIAIFALAVLRFDGYLLTYLNYFGELLVALILGSGEFSLDATFGSASSPEWSRRLEPYSFLFLRVCFGIAVFYASFYAKFLHSNLALDTVQDYHLTQFFHFTPLFLVLGAFLVEATIGLFFALGFEIRFTALVFTTFLTMSILYFGEVVWPHLILFGINFALFAHGYDRYTLEHLLFRNQGDAEPVL